MDCYLDNLHWYDQSSPYIEFGASHTLIKLELNMFFTKLYEIEIDVFQSCPTTDG